MTNATSLRHSSQGHHNTEDGGAKVEKLTEDTSIRSKYLVSDTAGEIQWSEIQTTTTESGITSMTLKTGMASQTKR